MAARAAMAATAARRHGWRAWRGMRRHGWRLANMWDAATLFESRGAEHVGEFAPGKYDCMHYCAVPGVIDSLGTIIAKHVEVADFQSVEAGAHPRRAAALCRTRAARRARAALFDAVTNSRSPRSTSQRACCGPAA